MRLCLAVSSMFLLLQVGCSDNRETPADVTAKTSTSTGAESLSARPDSVPADLSSWVGAYSSPSEIEGFSGTKLVVEHGFTGGLRYSKTFYSDVVSADAINQDVIWGEVAIDGDRIYIPEANGNYRDGKPELWSSIESYTRLEVNGLVVLMRDDALHAYRKENRLYDYGILIKVSDEVPELLNFDLVEHKSIKLLYDDPKQGWQDPFVSGPNSR